MSWAPDLFIGELQPWPDSVYVMRGKTDEARRYVPEDERDMYRDLVGCMVHPDVSDQLQAENAKLRELCERAYIELQFNGNVTDAATEQLIEDMRELGIEVGE